MHHTDLVSLGRLRWLLGLDGSRERGVRRLRDERRARQPARGHPLEADMGGAQRRHAQARIALTTQEPQPPANAAAITRLNNGRCSHNAGVLGWLRRSGGAESSEVSSP